MKNIAVLTGGGDCPGLNAVIRAVFRTADAARYQVLGVRNGWQGLIRDDFIELKDRDVSGILTKGGTVLGTSRTNPFRDDGDVKKLLATVHRRDLAGIVAIGGDDTLGVADRLCRQYDLPVVGVPKTIDNDLQATDYTFGFHTAVQIVTDAIDRLHSTAESHHRIMVVEVMGRHAGWIAMYGGLAGGADWIVIPEKPYNLDLICDSLRKRHEVKNFSIVVVAEGAVPEGNSQVIVQGDQLDAFGQVRLGGIGYQLANEIEERTGIEARVAMLGYIQRGGTPTAYDRVLATRLGVKAMKMVEHGEFGRMASLLNGRITSVALSEAVGSLKMVDDELYETARIFFG